MARDNQSWGGTLGPYESVLADWATFVAKLGHDELAPNALELDGEGNPRLCYVKPDGEPLQSNSGGDPYRKITIDLGHLKSVRPS